VSNKGIGRIISITQANFVIILAMIAGKFRYSPQPNTSVGKSSSGKFDLEGHSMTTWVNWRHSRGLLGHTPYLAAFGHHKV